MIYKKLCRVFLLLTILVYPIGTFAGNIDPDNDGSQYAWSENAGWINFEPSDGPGVTVTHTGLTGFAWSENLGWINLSPSSHGGVFNNGGGCLTGFAWSENAGWINFAPSGAGVCIDPQFGVITGGAWGENVGWINFEPNGVPIRTSWTSEDGDGIKGHCIDEYGIDHNIDGYIDAFGTFVDESTIISRNFSDQTEDLDGTTYGVVGVQNVAVITVEDAEDPEEGVLIKACGFFYRQKQIPTTACNVPINLTSGDSTIVTCGSMTARVLSGPIEFPLVVNELVVSVPSQATVKIAEVAEGLLKIENAGGTGTIIIENQGQVTELDPGTSLYLGGTEVTIDIKPGSDPNCLNLNGNGVIPVAINGSDDFYVANIDVSSLNFAGLEVRVKNNDTPQCSIEDWNEDGFDDLVCQFVDDPDGWITGDTEASLTGLLNDGTPIWGTDSICIVP